MSMPVWGPATRLRSLVLFVEGNVTHLHRYATVLAEESDVLTAAGSEDGYLLARAKMPDVILMDVTLPDSSGFGLAERLRTGPETASIPIVVLTGDVALFERAQQMRATFAGVLMTPCPPDRLLRTVRDVMGRQR